MIYTVKQEKLTDQNISNHKQKISKSSSSFQLLSIFAIIYIFKVLMQQQLPKKQIKSIKQVSDDLRNAKQQFDFLINCLAIPNLSLEEDLEKRFPTIDMILRDVPSEQRLHQMLEHPNATSFQTRARILTNYKGKYDIIKKAAENIDNLKPQAQKIYYLAAQLNLYKLTNPLQDPSLQIRLKTHQISQQQNFRVTRHERNTIAPNYLRQLKLQQLRSTTNTNTSEYLALGETLVSVNLYDSINGEKIYQYVCYGEQTLLQLVSKFYCLVAKLEGKDTTQHHNSFCLIEENFYYQGIAAKKKIEEIINFSSQALNDDYQPDQAEKVNMVIQMSKTKLKNLRVVFGRPYLYRHLQGCDHIFIFKDLKILTQSQANDPTKKDKYPLIVFEGRMRRRKCQGCKNQFADIVSLNDALKGGRHLYLCQSCHKNIHHSASRDSHTFIRYIHD